MIVERHVKQMDLLGILHLHKHGNMYKSLSAIVLASFLFIGCAESGSDAETKEIEAVIEEDATSNTVRVDIDNSGDVPAQTEAVSTGEVALNPAHGEPGHDCAIAVGAPLNGSGGSPQIQQTVTTQPATPQAQGPVATPANGINPAHGQPGHDCAVAVGAPLPAK